MRTIWILMALVPTLVVWGCQAKEQPAAEASDNAGSAEAAAPRKALNLTGRLTATVIKTDTREVPENAVLKLELRHMVDPSSRDTVLLSSSSVPVAKLPAKVELTYDSANIEEREIYLLNVAVTVDGKLLYGTDVEVPVLTYGKGEDARVVVKPANVMRSRL
jgi:uncharacterized lipoprotein YbaY